ncbi:hypothetical protein BX661DRAFT_219896, partial [Kickxella alabastrina]|uniref:uncharacterized protein n=1 Tax=Kickxella alabastrina TaxID=61397 RepID=UPI002220F330
MHKPIALIPCISAVFLCACSLVSAHIELKEPPPRHSQFSKFYMDNDEIDYSMKSPLGPIVGYPCRNFKAGPTQGTMIAGHPFRVKFDGIATHLGGDCQFAVSYDNGTNFAVIWDKIATAFSTPSMVATKYPCRIISRPPKRPSSHGHGSTLWACASTT